MGKDASEDSVPELREWQRKQNALKRDSEYLEDDYPENKNCILASNQVASELGVFSDQLSRYSADRHGRSLNFDNNPGREWSAQREKLIQVQTRLSALQAQLNTVSILEELWKISTTPSKPDACNTVARLHNIKTRCARSSFRARAKLSQIV